MTAINARGEHYNANREHSQGKLYSSVDAVIGIIAIEMRNRRCDEKTKPKETQGKIIKR